MLARHSANNNFIQQRYPSLPFNIPPQLQPRLLLPTVKASTLLYNQQTLNNNNNNSNCINIYKTTNKDIYNKLQNMEPYWSEANGHASHPVKYESEAAVSSFPYCTESSLNFSTSATTYSEDDAEYATGRRNKTSRQDPLSHRIIEKRRRDRMNSCLADLSRLIPPQYQRKGRGRIEKTEIIEMAIRHLKHLQSECIQKENDYRLGYMDCMKEAAKFLMDSHMQEFCYRLISRLQEHCDEVLKGDCYKARSCHVPDNVSASSGSPHQAYHAAPPMCQLREMLGTSDIEHSNDHNDVKDLSFRNHLNHLQRNHISNNGSIDIHNGAQNHTNSNIGNQHIMNNAANNSTASVATKSVNCGSPIAPPYCKPPPPTSSSSSSQQHQPHQAAVITSTAPTSLHHHLLSHHHTDSSNHDFESSREPLLHTDTSNMHSPPPRDTLLHAHSHSHLSHHQHTSDSQMSDRMRNFSESSHDIEHNNNYKYKNHIKERFNHEIHDEETSSEHCPAPPLIQNEHSHSHALSEHSKDGTEPEIAPIIAKKRKLAEAASSLNGPVDPESTRPPIITTTSNTTNLLTRPVEEKTFSFADIKSELSPTGGNSLLHSKMNTPSSTTHQPITQTLTATRSFAVPIFALHGQGTYYVPLNVDYNVLLPFLNGIDLLEKNYSTMPVVHPININVNFMAAAPSTSLLAAAAAAAAVAAGKQQTPPTINGTIATNAAVAAAAVAKAKLEAAITNGW